MDRLARFRHINQLTNRAAMMCDSKEKLRLFLTKGLFSVALTLAEQGVLNAAKIEAANDLGDVAATLKDGQARSQGQSKVVRRDSVASDVKCFKCQGTGHKSFECDRKFVPTCYVCQQSGHKSWDCPSKQSRITTPSYSGTTEPARRIGVKPGDPPPKKVNWMAMLIGWKGK